MSEHLYYLRTLSAEAVLDQFCADAQVIDLTNSFTADAVISSTGRYGESAMLYQLLCVLEPDQEAREALRKNRDALKDVVFFLDFGGIFLSGNDERKKAAEKLLREGLALRFAPGAEPARFAAFDKSNSMARAGRIAYLRADLPERMHGRLMLDMQGFQANLSKVYAYRGLYFSDADRIESEALVLNEKTVVVLPDDEDLIANAKGEAIPQAVFTADADETDTDGYDIWKTTSRVEEIVLNRFDGEGLLTPAAAEAINAALGPGADNTSFQIRMPFGKGMLHEVDFHAFFSELLPEGASADDLRVKDLYGHMRKLSDCQILLTKSMFKCHKWLKTHCENIGAEDPMKYYFDKMREYDHALYISNTDEMLRDPSCRVELNYQFLNPLDLTDEEFSALVEGHFEYADRLEHNRYYQQLQSEKPADPAAQDSAAADETLLRHEKAAWARAVHKNPDFLWDRHVKKTLESLRQSVERDCTLGRLSVPGACRFLARDLLALLVFAAKKQLYLGEKPLFDVARAAIRAVQRECLAPDRFYLPGKTVKLWSKEHCVLLRNPHLARNEECMLRPLVPDDSHGARYLQLFGHLTGVVMVPYDSLVPMALGGADFDGDLVKVVTDQNVTRAVARGVYSKTEADGKATWERALPVISIPAPAGPDSDVTAEIDVPTIRNTFSSRVGQISNMAIRFGKEEYGADPPESVQNKCAECSILTGLEIDASKTGRHPSLRAMQKSMEALYKGRKDEKDAYLELKDRVHALRPGGWHFSERTDDSVRIWVKGARGFAVQQRGSRLDQLLWRYLARLEPEQPQEKPKKREEKPRLPLFRDEKAAALDPEKDASVQEILEAYSAVLRETARLAKARRRYQRSNYSGRCRTIILQQYSAMTDPIGDYFPDRAYPAAPEETVEVVLLRAWSALHNHFDGDADAAYQALQSLVEKQWHFCTLSEREGLLGELGLAEKLSKNAVCMLTRFDCGGYRLFYYMLKDVCAIARREQDTEIDDETEPDAAGTPAEGGVIAAYRALVLPRLRENAETSVWKNELIERCREDLKRAVGAERLADAVPYVYGRRVRYDPDGRFFWDLFRWEDLRDQISPAEKKGETVHAG